MHHRISDQVGIVIGQKTWGRRGDGGLQALWLRSLAVAVRSLELVDALPLCVAAVHEVRRAERQSYHDEKRGCGEPVTRRAGSVMLTDVNDSTESQHF
jgi:hypothetical protein